MGFAFMGAVGFGEHLTSFDVNRITFTLGRVDIASELCMNNMRLFGEICYFSEVQVLIHVRRSIN
jgi:hypothetical protein